VTWSWRDSARVLVQREYEEKCLAEGKEDAALRAGIFKASGSIGPMYFALSFSGGDDFTPPLVIIVRDESARLSLSMVASPQSLLLFHLTM